MFSGGFMEISEVDLEFIFEGKKTYMEFHRYCGPSFYTLKPDGYEDWIYPDDTSRFTLLWEEFYKWFNAEDQKHLHYKGD
jgi:hypothetical protein